MQAQKRFHLIALLAGLAWACHASESGKLLTVAFSGSANGMVRSCHCPSAPWGGLAKRAWLLDQIRLTADAMLVIDSGDLFPVNATSGRAALMLNLLALMNYDAVAIGDQELRGGLDSWIAANREAGFWDEETKRSSFPWLSGGYRLTQGPNAHQVLAPPWVVLNRGGLRVGIVSLVGPEAWRLSPSKPEGASMTDPTQIIADFLENTRGMLDLALVLSHQGLEADRELASRIHGVDLIIGGHSQSLISPPEIVNGIAICQPGKNGENLGVLVMTPLRPALTGETPGQPQPHGPSPDPAGNAEANPFLPAVVETLRWRIAQQIIPLNTAIDDDSQAAALIAAHYAAIDYRNAERLSAPDPSVSPDAPQITVAWPAEPVKLKAGERTPVPVRIANRGGSPLLIERVRSKSPWLEVRSFPARIPPGEEIEAILEVTAERIDRFFRCEFSIMANDPQRRVVQGAFAGQVEGPVPGRLDVPTLWSNLLALCRVTPDSNHDETGVQIEDAASAARQHRLLVEYFYAPGCPDCREIERYTLPAFTNRFGAVVDFRKYDVTVPANYLRLARLQEQLNVRSNEPVSMYVDGSIPLLGIEAIRAGLERLVVERLKGATVRHEPTGMSMRAGAPLLTPPAAQLFEPTEEATDILKQRMNAFTLLSVIVAGLVDGINPCAFAAIVFFISLLSVSGVKAGRLLLVGAGYTGAVFFTYLLMGFGAFRLLQALQSWQWLADGMRWAMIGLLALLALLSFLDAWRYRRTGHAADVTLQLPKTLKVRMHDLMRKRLNPAHLFLSALLIGVLVTLIEAVCTGQVYLPTLVLMSRRAETQAHAVSLLLIYNLAFVVPLIIIIAAAFFGTRNQRLIEWSKRNVVWGKISMGLLFTGLAVVLAVL